MTEPTPPLKLYVFSPKWGLPTHSPFTLKLATWMRLTGLPHQLVFEDDPRKGPKKKAPWIELDGVPMGDSELIIAHLQATLGVDPDAHLTRRQAAQALVLRRTFEEHFAPIYDYFFFVDDVGWEHARSHFDFLPALIRPVVLPLIRSDTRKELWLKGIGRHDVDDIAAFARADLDAAATLLDDQPFFFGDRPTTTDCTLYGFLAMVLHAPIASPVQAHLRTLPNLVAFCDRMRARFWAHQEDNRAA